MADKVCVVVGVGPGNGVAFARRFADDGYKVALVARSADKLAAYADAIEGAKPFACDVSDPAAIQAAFTAIKDTLGPVDVLLYNAGSGSFSTVEETTPEMLEQAWRINTLGLLAASRQVIPDMLARGGGAIVITGATASLRGGAKTTAFASAKAAQRSLAQSMAKTLGPKGIHVSLVIVDGVIDLERTRAMMPDAPDDFFLKPDDIAASVHWVAHQPRSAWTFEYDIRPFGETW